MNAPAKSRDSYDQFIGIYNKLDAYMRKVLRDNTYTEHSFLVQQMARKHPVFARHEHELKVFARLRNALIHNPFMGAAHPIATPNPAIIERYQNVCQTVLNPPTALSIAVPANKIYTTTVDSVALSVMRAMADSVFTHVPVMEDQRMTGVFSENTILSYLVHHKDAIITSDIKIKEFADFIGINKHASEHFEFLPRTAMLEDVYRLFNKAVKVQKRIGMVFITEHGKSEEKLLGIITAWDLASPEFTV